MGIIIVDQRKDRRIVTTYLLKGYAMRSRKIDRKRVIDHLRAVSAASRKSLVSRILDQLPGYHDREAANILIDETLAAHPDTLKVTTDGIITLQ